MLALFRGCCVNQYIACECFNQTASGRVAPCNRSHRERYGWSRVVPPPSRNVEQVVGTHIAFPLLLCEGRERPLLLLDKLIRPVARLLHV
jgi:hypothetical protein